MMFASRRDSLVLAAVIAAVGVVLFFFGESIGAALGVGPIVVGRLTGIVGVAIVVGILWWAALADWARRPDGTDSRKDKQRS